MARPKELDKPESISLIIERAQLRYLQSNGMDRSKFMRQAVEAHKAGKWDYEFIKVESDEEHVVNTNNEDNIPNSVVHITNNNGDLG